MRVRYFALCAGLAALLLALPASAGVDVIRGGIDLWQTPADGSTYADFATDPVPAGFFCPGSAPFAGKIVFRGAPIETAVPGSLGPADTIVVRLDDARFNARGVASTRIQLRALSLVGVAPIQTACGAFRVSAQLAGEQPITGMRIVRSHETGGQFVAPLSLRMKLVFTPADGLAGEPRELLGAIDFRHEPGAWSTRPGKGGLEVAGSVLVDTNGDRVTDTRLPGTTNFFPGWSSARGLDTATAAPTCHCDPSQTFGAASSIEAASGTPPCAHLHCPEPVLQ